VQPVIQVEPETLVAKGTVALAGMAEIHRVSIFALAHALITAAQTLEVGALAASGVQVIIMRGIQALPEIPGVLAASELRQQP
jgi:hypothetical protein